MKKVFKPKIIIDTDPGHDDALAILLLLKSNLFEVVAITTVAGNATIEKVTRNAQAIVDLTGQKIPIFSGLKNPLKRQLITAVVHGESGLAGFDTSQTNFKLTKNAPEKIIELVEKNPGEITILALGPLSNIARAIIKKPTIASKIKQLIMMGGAIEVPGNKNRVAEFNFFVDPEAANVVFKTDIEKVLVPLDACNQVVMQVNDFRQIKNASLKKILLPMMEHFLVDLTSDEGTTGILVYDALAAFFLIAPATFKLQKMNVVIETKGEHTFGMSVAERRSYKKIEENVGVVTKANGKKFINQLLKILSE